MFGQHKVSRGPTARILERRSTVGMIETRSCEQKLSLIFFYFHIIHDIRNVNMENTFFESEHRLGEKKVQHAWLHGGN